MASEAEEELPQPTALGPAQMAPLPAPRPQAVAQPSCGAPQGRQAPLQHAGALAASSPPAVPPPAAPSPSNPAPLLNLSTTVGPASLPRPPAGSQAGRPAAPPAPLPSFPRLAGLPPGLAVPRDLAASSVPRPAGAPIAGPAQFPPQMQRPAGAVAAGQPALKPAIGPLPGTLQAGAAGAAPSPGHLLAAPVPPFMRPMSGTALVVRPPPPAAVPLPAAVAGIKRRAEEAAGLLPPDPPRAPPPSAASGTVIGVPMLPHPAAASTAAVLGHPVGGAAAAAGPPPLFQPSSKGAGEGEAARSGYLPSDEEEEEGLLGRGEAPASEATSAAGTGGEGGSHKKARLVWTQELHNRFINALSHLGLKNAVPKSILALMNVEGMTRENVASHLQKYRLYLRRLGGLGEKDRADADALQRLHEQNVQAMAAQQMLQHSLAAMQGPPAGVLAAMGIGSYAVGGAASHAALALAQGTTAAAAVAVTAALAQLPAPPAQLAAPLPLSLGGPHSTSSSAPNNGLAHLAAAALGQPIPTANGVAAPGNSGWGGPMWPKVAQAAAGNNATPASGVPGAALRPPPLMPLPGMQPVMRPLAMQPPITQPAAHEGPLQPPAPHTAIKQLQQELAGQPAASAATNSAVRGTTADPCGTQPAVSKANHEAQGRHGPSAVGGKTATADKPSLEPAAAPATPPTPPD